MLANFLFVDRRRLATVTRSSDGQGGWCSRRPRGVLRLAARAEEESKHSGINSAEATASPARLIQVEGQFKQLKLWANITQDEEMRSRDKTLRQKLWDEKRKLCYTMV